MNELTLFAGAGGGILGGKLLGWRTICAVEIDDYCRRVLMQRQDDGHLEPFPIWDDVRTFDGRPWRGRVDVVSGGFPCQDISCAGKGAGIDGERSELWGEMARIIREVQPRFAFVENSPMLVSRGLAVVVTELVEMGFDCRWGVFSACSIGASHTRERLFIVADSLRSRERGKAKAGKPFKSHQGCKRVVQGCSWWAECDLEKSHEPEVKPLLGRNSNGMAYRVDRLRATGNGQVPAVAALAWEALTT